MVEILPVRFFGDVLTDPYFYIPLILCSLLQPATYFAAIYFIPNLFNNNKNKAWILTTLSSTTMTFGALPLMFQFFFIENVPISQSSFTDSPYVTVLSAFFITYVFFDLVMGHIFYRDQMNIDSGYVHHTIYTILVFLLIQWRLSSAFVICGIMELPTMLMAFATLNKRLRHDNLFGGSFFATRILFHLYMIYHMYVAYPQFTFSDFLSLSVRRGSCSFFVPLAVLPLHIMWFRGWIYQQIRLYKKKTEEAKMNSSPNNVPQKETVKTATDVHTKPMKVRRRSPREYDNLRDSAIVVS